MCYTSFFITLLFLILKPSVNDLFSRTQTIKCNILIMLNFHFLAMHTCTLRKLKIEKCVKIHQRGVYFNDNSDVH